MTDNLRSQAEFHRAAQLWLGGGGLGSVAIVGYRQQGQECFDSIKGIVPVAAFVDPSLRTIRAFSRSVPLPGLWVTALHSHRAGRRYLHGASGFLAIPC